jgi:hypothetical protein
MLKFRVSFRHVKSGIFADVYVSAFNYTDATTKALEAMEGANFLHCNTIESYDSSKSYD